MKTKVRPSLYERQSQPHHLNINPQTFRDGYVTIEEMIVNTKPLQEYCRATPKKMDALATALSVFWGEVGLKPGKKVS